MAITLNATISTDIRMVLAGEQLADFRETREEMRSTEKGDKLLNKREAHIWDLMTSDLTDEELLKVIVTDVLKRDLADTIREELPKGSRVAPVKVTFRSREVAAPVCNRCEVVKCTTSHTQCEVCRTCAEVS